MFQGAGEKSPGGCQVPLLGDQHVNDLSELVDGPVQTDTPTARQSWRRSRPRTSDHLEHVDTVLLRRSIMV
jgi:hypothetical protein